MVTLTVTGAVLVGGIMLFGLIEQEFSPPSPSRQINLSVSVPSTFEMADIRAVFDQAEQVLR